MQVMERENQKLNGSSNRAKKTDRRIEGEEE